MGPFRALRTRLSVRLFTLFVLAALLPLGLSDWLASSAVREVADRHSQASRTQMLRQTSRQVFDRLRTGKTLLAALPAGGPAAWGGGAADVAGLSTVFEAWVWLDAPGHIGWHSAAAPQSAGSAKAQSAPSDLWRAWQAAQPHPAPRPAVPLRAQGDLSEIELRVATPPGQPAQVLLGARQAGQWRWLAQVKDGVLWEPVRDGAENARWQVHDEAGRLLMQHLGADAAAPGTTDEQTLQVALFLGAEFGAGEWRFTEHAPAPEILWQGLPLRWWLSLVGLGTLLLVALISLRELRRALRPLAELTTGARQLADGARLDPVPADRDDELGLLARAFNHMAARIEDRELQLRHRAAHDSLTGLANRDGLHEHLDRALAAGDAPLAVLFLDLDHFKDVNDSHGHETGDAVLRLAAARLKPLAGPGHLVARQGGDEFVLVLPGADAAAATALAEVALQALAHPYLLPQGEMRLGASVGMALAPAHGRSREELLRCADIALYAAKAGGRGGHQLFDPALDQAARQRLQLQAELRQALAGGELCAHYQPRVDAVDGRIRSAEALVRWQHPQRGLLMPGAFIEVAEDSGLIEALGLQMLETVCAQLAQWQRQGLPALKVSVNVSPRQLASGLLPGQVRLLLDRHQVPAGQLELEVTESLMVGDTRSARAQLETLRGWGVTVAMDDFGTGYSSLSTLQTLPIDVIKVDRAFVQGLGQDNSAWAITSAIVALAKALRLHLVAEGIETETQARLLRELGCHELQGFLYSRAVPPEALMALLRQAADAAAAPAETAALAR